MKHVHIKTLIAATVVSFSGALFAQTNPNKPIKLIVPFPAGGATDVLARVVSQKLGDKLGQALVVENRPGAGGVLGADLAAKSAADGYTLLFTTSSTHSVGPTVNPKIPYNAQADFTPIIHMASSPNVVLVPASSPAKSVAEFIALAKSKPGQLNYASSGNGTVVHLSTEYFKALSNTFIVHIPYRGTALAIPDLISGKLDLLIDSFVSGMPHARDGKLRALAVTTAKRTALAPNLPTVAETLPGYESSTWFGLFAPKGLAAESVQKINQAANAVLQDAEVKDRLSRLGAEAVGGTPQALADIAAREQAAWRKIIAQRGLTID